MLDVLSDVPRAAVLRDGLGLEAHGDEVVVGADDDPLRSESRSRRPKEAREGPRAHPERASVVRFRFSPRAEIAGSRGKSPEGSSPTGHAPLRISAYGSETVCLPSDPPVTRPRRNA
jgi:hypothetical protein